MSDRSQRKRRVPWLMVGIVAAMVMLYASAYYAMLKRGFIEISVAESDSVYVPILEYRFGGDRAYVFFRPMYLLDARMRPEYWDQFGETEEEPPPP